MKIGNTSYRSIWCKGVGESVQVIDQQQLPHHFVVATLRSMTNAADAISAMVVRGAPLIGATAAYGMALGMNKNSSDKAIHECYNTLLATRPTAVNLVWALAQMRTQLLAAVTTERVALAYQLAEKICDDDVSLCKRIGEHGVRLIENIWQKTKCPVQILTHCNAGWLATVDWGTALAPIYLAHQRNIPVHVWVDETRPRNQGARLTAWELGQHGIQHTVIVDNAGGHLMQRGSVDLCLVGTDRTTRTGDVANKIGTYLKALAAFDNKIPFYVALPSPTIDWQITDGLTEIPIEERSQAEVHSISDATAEVRLTPKNSPALNMGFDVTPARLITGLITERGICTASESGLFKLFPEQRRP